jgi:hypothetical protein
VYHLELRKFPHVVCRFNQSEAQLRALVIPWTRQEWIEEGERKWNVNEATLTILEGPKLSMPDLAMGKGWRNAQKRSQDVTERVLSAARKGGGQGPGQDAGALGGDLLADSLALELLALLDGAAVAPSRVWLMAQERLEQRGGVSSAVDALALAERAVGSLLGRRLAVLRRDRGGEGDRPAGGHEHDSGDRRGGEVVAPEQQETVLAAVETWAGDGRQPVVIARKG